MGQKVPGFCQRGANVQVGFLSPWLCRATTGWVESASSARLAGADPAAFLIKKWFQFGELEESCCGYNLYIIAIVYPIISILQASTIAICFAAGFVRGRSIAMQWSQRKGVWRWNLLPEDFVRASITPWIYPFLHLLSNALPTTPSVSSESPKRSQNLGLLCTIYLGLFKLIF